MLLSAAPLAQRCFWDEGRAGFVEAADLSAVLPVRRTVIGVETAEGARDLYAPGAALAPTTATHALVLIFGAESTGISPPLLALCDFHVFLPCPGPMKSLNVSQCVAAVLCEWVRQSRYVRGERGYAETVAAHAPRKGEGVKRHFTAGRRGVAAAAAPEGQGEMERQIEKVNHTAIVET